MKKDILFIINNLHFGGAEKSLISLLQTIDFSSYNVDLLLLKNEGLLKKQVPSEVNILPSPKNYSYFDMSFKKAFFENISSFSFKLLYYRILAGFLFKRKIESAEKEQMLWKYLNKVIPKLNKKYDVAVGYLEKTPNYYCVDKVIANKKIGFIHTDYLKLKMNSIIDLPYFEKLDTIVTVSQPAFDSLTKIFPTLDQKFRLMNNIVSTNTIQKLALKKISFKSKGITLVSIGRLINIKGFDIALQACKIIKEKGYTLTWLVVGEGPERKNLETCILNNNLEENFKLLGLKENPYPYLRISDVFVHTARFEGFGIVVQEAKILRKPIVITNFNTSKTLIQHNYNGLISEMTPESVADNIELLIKNKHLRKKFSKNLDLKSFGTEHEIDTFYNIINNSLKIDD